MSDELEKINIRNALVGLERCLEPAYLLKDDTSNTVTQKDKRNVLSIGLTTSSQ